MAFTVLTEDPSAREVGDLIIVDDRLGYVDVLGLLDQNFVKIGGDEATDETEPGKRDPGDEAKDDGDDDETGDEEEDDEADEEAEDDDTESERS
ncbi:MAG: hypothetical protein JWM55_750 [Acidimicrobiaceae bacterium]|nr:hypothetical protein [Acidimicrobiaceae bacterium]